MKTYYIVEHATVDGSEYWCAYKRGILSALNIFNPLNVVLDSISWRSADHCAKKLRRALDLPKPKVLCTLRI